MLDRRQTLIAMPALILGCNQPSAQTSSDASRPLSEKDRALKHKFRGIRGGERRIDAIVVMHNVALFNDKGYVIETGSFGPNAGSTSGYSGDDFPIPKTVRMMYHGKCEGCDLPGSALAFNGDPTRAPYFKPPVITDVTVSVAERIPNALLDILRKYGGGLRIKHRCTPDTLLLGWEIRPGSSYPYKKAHKFGIEYDSSEDFMIGGDFCERRVVNVLVNNQWQLVEKKGWYIHPKTGQRIETDF